MNKQELIEKYKNKYPILSMDLWSYNIFQGLWKDIKQLDEPQKVTIPQGIADYIKYAKENDWDLQDAMNLIVDEEDGSFSDWFYKDKNMETFALAWINGYTVEEEKRYSVKIKGEIEENLLVYGLGINRYFFARTYDSSKRNEHTRKELEEAGFGDVFNSPLFEVEEVE